MAKVTDRERAIDSLQRLFDFAWREEQIALEQAKASKEAKDFQAMDRHKSYAVAMLKMQHQVRAHASNLYFHDVYGKEQNGKQHVHD